MKLIAEAASRCRKRNDNLVRSLRPAQALVTWIERAEAATRARDYDTLESLLIKLLRDLKRDTQERLRLLRRRRSARAGGGRPRSICSTNLEAFQHAADADLAAMLRAEMWDLVEQLRRAETPRRQARLSSIC